MNKPQLTAIIASVAMVAVIFYFGKTTSKMKTAGGAPTSELTIDSILNHAKKELLPSQQTWLQTLENSVSRGDVKGQQMDVYHQLAHFWKDSAGLFEPYAWYEAEAARLELSEKSLTFAAHLFLDNMRGENNPQLKKWKALQAKDLFERSLKINNRNDSSIIGLGSCYLFGGIAESPMEGILKIREVADRDSTNVYAQMTLGHGSVLSGQYDKAIERFLKVNAIEPANIEALLMLGEVFERKADKQNAIIWYNKAIPIINNPNLKNELSHRIEELSK